jgi:uncharacterized protein (DUF1800 family)
MITTMEKIRHLYWRAGFGLSPEEWRERRNWPLEKAIDELFKQANQAKTVLLNSAPPVREEGGMAQMLEKERMVMFQQNHAWVGRMGSNNESALLEQMCLFWHGHFACRITIGKLGIQYLNALRQHGLGNFRDLLLAISKTPAMIRYLNNQQNRKGRPNENFAREVLELFTMGRGNYQEKDIKEAARAFTGWTSTLLGEFEFRDIWHDEGNKSFLGKTGAFKGEDIVDIILQQPATAPFIVRKLYRYFVNEQVDEKIVAQLSQDFRQSNYDLGKLMRQIFSSTWFYAPANLGKRIKSPVQFMAGLMHSTKMNFSQAGPVLFMERSLGQILFNPPNVAGWPGGKSWIDNSTLTLRLNLPAYLLNSEDVGLRTKGEFEDEGRETGAQKLVNTHDLSPLYDLVKSQKPVEMVQELADYLLLVKPTFGLDNLCKDLPLSDRNAQIRSMALRLMTLPEYQMC